MFFALDDEQAALRDAVRGYLNDNASLSHLRDRWGDLRQYRIESWVAMVKELDVASIGVPEALGGAGGGCLEVVIVAEELGRQVYPGPFLSTMGLARSLLSSASASAELAKRALNATIEEGAVATVAYAGRDADVSSVSQGTTWTLNGEKRWVIDADIASLLIVPAVTDHGLGLFAVDPRTPGVVISPTPGLDPARQLADLRLTDAEAVPILVGDDARNALDRALLHAGLVLAAEQTGSAAACLASSVSYAKTRQQFGRPIGAFQAIKHKCADMFVAVETTRTQLLHAAYRVEVNDEPVRELHAMVSALAERATDSANFCAAQMIQIHGGIGYTWEHDAHFYFKRARSDGQLLGSAREHRARVAAHILTTT